MAAWAMATSEVGGWAMAAWAMARSEMAEGLEGRRQAQLAECSVVAVAAVAAGWGVLVVVVKVEAARAPGERVRAVAAVTGLATVVAAMLVRAVGAATAPEGLAKVKAAVARVRVARAQARAAEATTAVVARARARAWAAGALAVVVKVEGARAPGDRVRAVVVVTGLVGMAVALSVKEAVVARARPRGGAVLVVVAATERQL